MSDVERGKIICVSVPQRYPVERRYLQTLLKLAFYSHALRRFDRSADVRAKDNLIIFWAGEAQKVVTARRTVEHLRSYHLPFNLHWVKGKA